MNRQNWTQEVNSARLRKMNYSGKLSRSKALKIGPRMLSIFGSSPNLHFKSKEQASNVDRGGITILTLL